MKKNAFSLLAVIVALAVVLPACATTQPNGAAKTSRVERVSRDR